MAAGRLMEGSVMRGIVLILSLLFLVLQVNGRCEDTHVKCKETEYKKLCRSSVQVRRECPRTCKTCTPSAEDVVFQNIIDAKHENGKMFIVTVAIIVMFTLGIFKVYNAPVICLSKGSMKGKTVVITGGTSGIGYETAFHLAKRGARVIIGCRKLKKGLRIAKRLREESKQKFIEVKMLDLSSLSSVRDFAFDVIEEEGDIDVLINNAATISKKERCATNDNFEETFQVNYLGHFLLTTLLIDKMKKNSLGCRIINVVCDFQYGKLNFLDLQSKHAFSPMQAYYNSKLALLYFTHELSKVLENTSITSYAVNPGVSESNLWRNVFPYSYRVTWLFLAPWVYLFCKNPSYGAETSYYCSLDRDIKSDSGKYYKNCKQADIGTFNDGKSKKLWEVSERLTEHYINHTTLSSSNDKSRKPRVTFDTREQEK